MNLNRIFCTQFKMHRNQRFKSSSNLTMGDPDPTPNLVDSVASAISTNDNVDDCNVLRQKIEDTRNRRRRLLELRKQHDSLHIELQHELNAALRRRDEALLDF